MKLEVIRIKQFGGAEGSEREFYISGVRFADINDKLEIDRWSRDNREGYQRITQIKKRIYKGGRGSILNYLGKQLGLFPTSILVAIRGEYDFDNPTDGDVGTLEIPNGTKLYVIDGMHRVEGLRAAVSEDKRFNDYVLNLALIPTGNNNKLWELLIFHIVNSRVGRVETDIAYRLVQTLAKSSDTPEWITEQMIATVERRVAKAATVVDFLAEDDNSPFAGQIQYYGEEKEPSHLISDAVLIRYISPLFKEMSFMGLDEATMAGLLEDYWSAVQELYPIAFSDPANYSLFGSHFGVATMSYLFPTIWAYCTTEGKVGKEEMKKLLNFLQVDVRGEQGEDLEFDFKKPIDDQWWSKSYGAGIIHATSERMFKHAVEQMTKKIAKVRSK